MRFVLLLAALPLWAADDADVILKRFIENQAHNDLRAAHYSYVEDAERFTYEKNRRLHKERMETFDVILIEGIPYQKLVARNGQPLPPRERAQVESEMQETATERRQHPLDSSRDGRIWFGSESADVGTLAELLTLFDNQLIGEAEIRDREVWVIESTPHKLPPDASDRLKEVLSFRKKFWIDKSDGVVVREVFSVEGEDAAVKRGSTLSFDYQKVDATTWAPYLEVLESVRWRGNRPEPVSRIEFRNSKFQRAGSSTVTTAVSQ